MQGKGRYYRARKADAYAEIQSDWCNKRNNSAYEHANFARPTTSSLPLALSLPLFPVCLARLPYLYPGTGVI